MSPCSFLVSFLISVITQVRTRKCDRRLFDRHPNKGAKNLLTISGSDTSGAGIQVGLFTGVVTAVVGTRTHWHRYVGKKG